jgi:uncharacterized protein YsxB (DUF464 family)
VVSLFERFEVLRNFLSDYFHLDVDLEYPVETGYIEEVITTLIEENNQEHIQLIIEQINIFLESSIELNSKNDFILENVNLDLDSQFINPIDFLVYVRNSLVDNLH